jgi:hypothetical protein
LARLSPPCPAKLLQFATELHKWMQKEPAVLPILLPGNIAFYNPYSRPASILIRAFQRVEHDCGMFARDIRVDGTDVVESEVRRIRLFSEFVLYGTRICEALIKQLLYCTGFDERIYRRAALGAFGAAVRCLPAHQTRAPPLLASRILSASLCALRSLR